MGIENCLQVDDSKLHITNDIKNTFSLIWSSSNIENIFQDCFDLNITTTNWFGGPERFYQKWPIEKLVLKDYPYVISDVPEWGAVAERYWLNSHGAYIFVDDKTPLFIDQNNIRNESVCFSARVDNPYRARTRVSSFISISKCDIYITIIVGIQYFYLFIQF